MFDRDLGANPIFGATLLDIESFHFGEHAPPKSRERDPGFVNHRSASIPSHRTTTSCGMRAAPQGHSIAGSLADSWDWLAIGRLGRYRQTGAHMAQEDIFAWAHFGEV